MIRIFVHSRHSFNFCRSSGKALFVWRAESDACNKTISPPFRLLETVETILFTPGFFQSFELLLQWTTVYPSDSAILSVALLKSPLGGRNSLICFTPSFVKHLVLAEDLFVFHLPLEKCRTCNYNPYYRFHVHLLWCVQQHQGVFLPMQQKGRRLHS